MLIFAIWHDYIKAVRPLVERYNIVITIFNRKIGDNKFLYKIIFYQRVVFIRI